MCITYFLKAILTTHKFNTIINQIDWSRKGKYAIVTS